MHKHLVALALAASLTSLAQAEQGPVQNLIVRLKPSADTTREQPQTARERLQAVASDARVRMTAERTIGEQFHVMRLPAPQSGVELEDTLRRLRLNPDVSDVEPDVRIKRLAVPTDPSYANQQWNLQSSADYASAINMPTAWDRSTGSGRTVVAVLDVGVRLGHPDLAGKLLPGYDFVSEVEYANDGNGRDSDPTDPGDWVSAADRNSAVFSGCEVEDSSWHGTFIAGQIAATTNNAIGIAGIDWQGKVLPVRIAGKCGALLSDLLDGMRWAAGLSVSGVPRNPNPARILNLSFGGDAACSPAYQAAIDDITDAGALLVVAAGNGSGTLKRPADCARVLAVGAVQDDGRKARYSDYGPRMGLMAPGGTSTRPIYSLDNAGRTGPTIETYGSKTGTSFASPQAAGVAALMLAVNPSLTPAQLVLRLQDSARPHVSVFGSSSCSTSGSTACNCDANTCGPGLLDAGAALALATSNQVPVAVIGSVSSPVAGRSFTLDGSRSQGGSGSVRSYEWSQVSGQTATLSNTSSSRATVTVPRSGEYVFRLRVTNSNGQRDETELRVSASSGGFFGGDGAGSTGWLWGAGLWLLAAMVWWQRRRRA